MVKLPEDMIIEILSILPVKSLIRFRCVSKSWYALVRSSSFISKHLKNDHNIHLIVEHWKEVEKSDFSNEVDNTESSNEEYSDEEADYTGEIHYWRKCYAWFPKEILTKSLLQNFSPQIPLRGLFLGPFDGILCIIEDGITLYNFATKEVRTLPKIKAIVHPENGRVGFGLDPLIVGVKNTTGTGPSYITSHIVEVYSLNSDSWRNVKGSNSNIDQYIICQEHHIYFNGACYWVARNKITKDLVIIFFHPGDEMLEEISKMPILHLDFDVTKCVDMWVLNQGHWIKHLTVGPFIDGHSRFWKRDSFFVLSRIYDSEDGHMRDKLLLCDPSSTQNTKYCCVFTGQVTEVLIYKESLVNIKREFDLYNSSGIA
ncbi:hypothetical protein ACOSQ4_004376 [Xanthoceras sorbifolium]